MRDTSAVGSRWARARGHRLGLRARVTFAFTAGALGLSASLALIAFGTAHHYLLSDRESAATSQAYLDARLVKGDLAAGSADVATVLSTLDSSSTSRVLVYRKGRWFSTSVAFGHHDLPARLTSMVLAGKPARQRITFDSQPAIAVGLPIPAVGVDYFEVHSLSELSHTLRTLGVVLVAAALLSTVGGTVIGLWASRRLARPFTDVTSVAKAISGGGLELRLPESTDRDLAPLVSAFNGMVDTLAERMRRDARFASDVSHELRSPLTTVRSSVELLGGFSELLPNEGAEAMERLGLEVGRLCDLVEDLLEMSRLDAGATALHLEEVELVELVGHAVSSQGTAAPKLEVSPGVEGTVVRADKRRIQRVLANLLDNADRYAGGATGVCLSRQGSWAHLTVEDAGPGIAPEDRERVFERFYRGASAGRRAGTSGSGLGLALVAEHVRAHGGTVTASERPGGGTRFTVALPVITT